MHRHDWISTHSVHSLHERPQCEVGKLNHLSLMLTFSSTTNHETIFSLINTLLLLNELNSENFGFSSLSLQLFVEKKIH